jgi:D-3-phosphoglycerate dehydrogenase
MTSPVIAVADGAFSGRHTIEREFSGQAAIRWADLSSPAATRQSTAGADAVVVTLQRLSAEIIDAFGPSVRVIGRGGVGLDTIDLAAAASRGIAVVNQPAYGAQEVASHALALLLAVHRRLLAADRYVGPAGPARLAWTGSSRWTRPRSASSGAAGSGTLSWNECGPWCARS